MAETNTPDVGFVAVPSNTIIEKYVAEGNRDPFKEADYARLADAVRNHRVRVIMASRSMDIEVKGTYVIIKPTTGELIPMCSLELERLLREYKND